MVMLMSGELFVKGVKIGDAVVDVPIVINLPDYECHSIGTLVGSAVVEPIRVVETDGTPLHEGRKHNDVTGYFQRKRGKW